MIDKIYLFAIFVVGLYKGKINSAIIILQFMTKRSATYDIDPRTFEDKERDDAGNNEIDPNGAHMKGRKYLDTYLESSNCRQMLVRSKPTIMTNLRCLFQGYSTTRKMIRKRKVRMAKSSQSQSNTSVT